MQLRVLLEPSEDGGYTVSVPSLPGCISEGDTREEALANIREAIELYLEPVDLQKHTADETLEVIVPAHQPVKRSTLAHILKQAQLSVDEFIALM